MIIPQEFSSSIKRVLVNFGKDIRTGRDDKAYSSRNGVAGMSLLNDNVAIWNLYSTLESIDFQEQARKSVHGYKANYAQIQKQKTEQSEQIKEYEPNAIKGYGTYLYPPILIGELKPTIREQIEDKEFDLLNENVVIDEFDEKPLIMTREGLVGIQTKKSRNVDQIISTIAATALLMDVPLHAHKYSELATLSFDKKTQKISGSNWSESSLRTQMFSYTRRFEPSRHTLVRLQISVKDMELILEEAKKIWKDGTKIDILKLILGAFTFFDSGEFSQSFILSWTVIEKHMYELWNKKLQSSKISNSRIRNLSDWNVYRITEILHLDRTISDDEYYKIKNLRDLRNDLFHDGYGVTETQTEDCFKEAFGIVAKKVEISKKIKANRILTI